MERNEGEAQKKGMTRNAFSPAEDARLHILVRKYGSDWKKISVEMGTRSIRQCRERFLNYLAPGVLNGPWTAQEDKLLIDTEKVLGRKWTTIAKLFKNRSGANVKNRWGQISANKKQLNPETPVLNLPPPPTTTTTPKPLTQQQQQLPASIQSTAKAQQHSTVQLPPINELSKSSGSDKLDLPKNGSPMFWNTSLADSLISENGAADLQRKGQNDLEKFRNFKGFAGLIW